MRTELKLPLLGDVMVEGTLAAWLKDDGASVGRGDPLYQLETDKVSYAVESPASGVLKQLVAAGETVPVGTVVGAVLDAAETSAGGTTTRATRESDGEAGARGATGESEGESGDVRASPAARRLARELGVDIAALGTTRRIRSEDVAAYAAANTRETSNGSTGTEVRATPAARRLAREHGVTLTPASRLLRVEDVQALLRAPAAGPRSQPMTGRRKVIGERMHASLQSMAQLTISMQVDVSEALRLRTQLTQLWGQDARPTITDLVSRAAILALAEHPDLNATLSDTTLTVYDEVHLGLAVDTPEGLIVPVVHNADRLALQALAATTRDLATRARENRLSLEDLQGGTFTVTTLGSLGVDFFTPIINPPQVAILGIGRTFDTLSLQDGKVESHSAMHLSLSFDHRAVDGAPAARFLGTIKRLLELPVALVVA